MLTRRRTLAVLTAATLTATTPAAWAQGGKTADVSGSYTAQGMNPDGSKYNGTVQITQQGTAVDMYWSIAGQTYGGTGQLDGRVLTVDWGDQTPVVYVLMGRELHGTWSDGTALEKLTPR